MNNPRIDGVGNKFWYNKNREFHRENGPAVEYSNGNKCWYFNGERHRQDGAAVEYTNGDKWWYINGKQIFCKDNEEFLRIVKLIGFK